MGFKFLDLAKGELKQHKLHLAVKNMDTKKCNHVSCRSALNKTSGICFKRTSVELRSESNIYTLSRAWFSCQKVHKQQ